MKSRNAYMIFIGVLCASGAGIAGCGGRSPVRVMPDDALVSVGDSVITRTEIIHELPPGLAPDDSARLFQDILRDRIDQLLLTDIAAENSEELERIESLTNRYRRRLIIESYRRRLRGSAETDPDNDTLRRYYRRNADRLVAERPLIKGIFIKIPTSSRHLSDLRRWMQIATPDAVDNIEKYGLADAVRVSFFEDRWVDFGVIEQQIPYRFYDADAFVESTPFFETSYGGMSYLLSIGDRIHTGQKLPYEAAVPVIRQIFEARGGEDLERRVIRELYDRALRSGYLKVVDTEAVKV